MKKRSKILATAMLFLIASLSPALASDPDDEIGPKCKKVTPFTEITGYCTPYVLPFAGEGGGPVTLYECEEEHAFNVEECEFELIW